MSETGPEKRDTSAWRMRGRRGPKSNRLPELEAVPEAAAPDSPYPNEMHVAKDKPAPLMTTSEAAQWLGITTAALVKLRQRNSGPSFLRFGRSVKYSPDDVEKYIEAHRHRTSPD